MPIVHKKYARMKKAAPRVRCDVIVGNIGTVESDISYTKAKKVYREYVKESKTGTGRAGNETVILMCNHDIVSEYYPDNYDPD